MRLLASHVILSFVKTYVCNRLCYFCHWSTVFIVRFEKARHEKAITARNLFNFLYNDVLHLFQAIQVRVHLLSSVILIYSALGKVHKMYNVHQGGGKKMFLCMWWPMNLAFKNNTILMVGRSGGWEFPTPWTWIENITDSHEGLASTCTFRENMILFQTLTPPNIYWYHHTGERLSLIKNFDVG